MSRPKNRTARREQALCRLIRMKTGIDPNDYPSWDYEQDGPPPWADVKFVDGEFRYTWPVITTKPRRQGVVRGI